MAGCTDIDNLEKDTRSYWDKYRRNPNNEEQILRDKYIPNLLPQELGCITRPNEKAVENCQKLVFLVGHSIEPILQSVCVYLPAEVLLVVNERYGGGTLGEHQADMVEDLIAELHKAACPELGKPKVKYTILEEDGPADVYKELQQNTEQTDGVVVDITGAKKKMVVGAFLFAALAEVPVSYVDFPDKAYDRDRRRPYGYQAKIGLISNPLKNFALQEWDRVRNLYERYKFQDARLLLVGEREAESWSRGYGTILNTMSEYIPASVDAVQKMANVFYCYELWDAGDYNAAKRAGEAIERFQVPDGIAALGERWIKIEGTNFEVPSAFYSDDNMLKAYIFDELARIKRLRIFNRDYRSAFLRAGGLNEIVNIARMVKIEPSQEKRVAVSKNLKETRTPPAKWLFKKLLLGESFNHNGFEFLPDGAMKNWWMSLSDNLFNQENGWKTFLYRRNDLAHTYVSVPKKWAEDAYEFVRANVEDFWPDEIDHHDTQAMPWSDLCHLAGLHEYLPPNLLKNSPTRYETSEGDK